MIGKGLKIRVAMAVLLAVMMAACGSSRKGVKSPSAAQYGAWQTLRVPVNLRVVSPQPFSTGSITMSMERDRSVTYSMVFLGMEVGAVHITADSLMAYSMPQRVYVAEDLASALGGASIPMADLQALLIGQSFPDFEKLPAFRKGSPFTVSTRTDAVSGLPESLTVAQSSPARSLVLGWERSEKLSDLPFAESLSLSLEGTKGTTFAATITYSWDRAKFDSDAPRRFKLPTHYKRVAGRDLLKALTSM